MLLAEQLLENDVIRDALRKSGDRIGAQDTGAAFGGTWAHEAALSAGRVAAAPAQAEEGAAGERQPLLRPVAANQV